MSDAPITAHDLVEAERARADLVEAVRLLVEERDALAARLDEREGDMHARIRAEYDRTIADTWRAANARIADERDEARAQLAALHEARSRLLALFDAEHPSQMPVSDVEALPETARIAIVERILGPGYRVSRVEGEGSVGDDLRTLSSIVQQGGEVGARYASALADGMVSPDEAAGLLPLVRELARTLTTLEHDLAATVRERGRRLRSMGGGRS